MQEDFKMGIISENFGTVKSGAETKLYTLENKKGTKIKVTNFGAALVSVIMADKDGKERDLVLGYDTAAAYENGGCYFGATVGRSANRIAGAKCTIAGVDYELEANDGVNNLHSGKNGVTFKVWEVKAKDEKINSITFTCESRDMEQGFPGNMKVDVTYTLSEEDVVRIDYDATADQETIANFTNHSYFNLDGHDSGVVYDQKLKLYASNYTPFIDAGSIPSGEIVSVKGTPMDFTEFKAIGQDIDSEFQQIQFGGGYDHSYVVDGSGMRKMAEACSEVSGIHMTAYTDLPGVQFYAANFVNGEKGKNGTVYEKRNAFCLESQYIPNAINQEGFESPIVKAGEHFHSRTEYRFEV